LLRSPQVCSGVVAVLGPARGLQNAAAAQVPGAYAQRVAGRSHFMVHFATGQGDSSSSTLEEARKRMLRRAEYDPPPPGIFPAEIVEYGPDIPSGRRVIERFPPD
jgi:hypothetical protein